MMCTINKDYLTYLHDRNEKFNETTIKNYMGEFTPEVWNKRMVDEKFNVNMYLMGLPLIATFKSGKNGCLSSSYIVDDATKMRKLVDALGAAFHSNIFMPGTIVNASTLLTYHRDKWIDNIIYSCNTENVERQSFQSYDSPTLKFATLYMPFLIEHLDKSCIFNVQKIYAVDDQPFSIGRNDEEARKFAASVNPIIKDVEEGVVFRVSGTPVLQNQAIAFDTRVKEMYYEKLGEEIYDDSSPTMMLS